MIGQESPCIKYPGHENYPGGFQSPQDITPDPGQFWWLLFYPLSVTISSFFSTLQQSWSSQSPQTPLQWLSSKHLSTIAKTTYNHKSPHYFSLSFSSFMFISFYAYLSSYLLTRVIANLFIDIDTKRMLVWYLIFYQDQGRHY